MRSQDGGVMKRLLSAFADRFRAKAATRRKRDLKRPAEKRKTYEEMTSRDRQGEPLYLHIVPSQDSGTLTAVMAALCEWDGTDRASGRETVRGRGVPSELSPGVWFDGPR